MKRRFLKFCSALLCIVNLFSVVPVWGVEYEFSGDPAKKSKVFITPVSNGFPSFYVGKSSTEALSSYNKHYSKIPYIDLNETILKEFYKAISGEKHNESIIDIYGEDLGTTFRYQLELNDIMGFLNGKPLIELQSELNKKIAERVGFIKCNLRLMRSCISIDAERISTFKFKNTKGFSTADKTIYLCRDKLNTIKSLIGNPTSNEIDISDVIFDNLGNLNNEEISNAIDKFYEKIKETADSMGKDYKVKNEQGANKKIKYKRDNKIQKYMSTFLANKFEEECKNRGGFFDFCTPFGKVKIEEPIKNGKKTFDCIVSCEKKVNGNYGSLSGYLDGCTKLELIKIYNYLGTKYDESLLENGKIDIDKFNRKIVQRFGCVSNSIPTDNRQKSLAVFCGALMVAEPWRFKDGGGLSRSSIRRAYKFMIGGVEKPFTIVFSDASDFLKEKGNIKKCLPQFMNVEGLGVMLDLKDGLAVFSHNKKDERKSDYLRNSFPYGGKWQQEDQIIGERNKSKESQRSFNDNEFRMHFFDEDVSDDEDVA